MTDQKEDLKNFQNPVGYWQHSGPFSIELSPEANKSKVPASAKIDGNTVRVQDGHLKQTIGGIQLYSKESPFYWGYTHIQVIRDGSGNLLWVNHNYK